MGERLRTYLTMGAMNKQLKTPSPKKKALNFGRFATAAFVFRK
jgi:hypothetical protein